MITHPTKDNPYIDTNNIYQPQRLIIWIHGQVQGVGFRWWVSSHAKKLGLGGYTQNYPDGRVYVLAQGPYWRCQRLLEYLHNLPAPGTIQLIIAYFSSPKSSFSHFSIR